jgi:hypothetical protein
VRGVETSGREARFRFLGKYIRMSLKMAEAITQCQNHGCFFFFLLCSLASIFSQCVSRLGPELNLSFRGSSFSLATKRRRLERLRRHFTSIIRTFIFNFKEKMHFIPEAWPFFLKKKI